MYGVYICRSFSVLRDYKSALTNNYVIAHLNLPGWTLSGTCMNSMFELDTSGNSMTMTLEQERWESQSHSESMIDTAWVDKISLSLKIDGNYLQI